ncbi:DUF1566 domain-containing protein [Tamlana sp. s12]|uniref:DUF1566 domain-containing protein n=1 Tax=Pseudotamlana haliotis TaxID=2614804 RepID=A0A6N6M9Z8_9FLAO|nr:MULTISPECIES: DUF1566 domain-containing protein [Tamlana]KAB1067338.1 DUF1566 domain-containing protein [Tamlana haliotis]OBQ51529.1 hypothetical protein VQ01_15365 [Tamlana sp. s12]QQY81567.1 DUF1566 domain-containing protein [Tamlana sp. s12]
MKKIILFTLILSSQFLFQSCDKEEAEPPLPTLAIGDFHEGGVIFHLDESGEHGLVCAVLDQGFDIEWGCPSLLNFGAKGLEIGTGAQNTLDIITACNTTGIAADLCDKLNHNGYKDWFLPSRDELDSLYQHRDIVEETCLENNGGYLHADEYWSSSHYLDNTVWIQSFGAGNQSSELKDKKNYVRAIRTF